MSLFKRVTATLTASVDNVVSRVENHDAIVESSIRECRRAAASTRVRLNRVQRDGQRMRDRQHHLDEDVAQWSRRAAGVAETDQEKALQCIKRNRRARVELEKLECAIREHAKVEGDLKSKLDYIESRIGEISQQRNAMRSRQSAAEAIRVIRHLEGDSAAGLDETFDRWETSLIEKEMTHIDLAEQDDLAVEFVENEERESLQAELAEIVANTKGTSHE